jgi:prepilin-type N-terminal cleavage/methylation domain-containing protein
MCTPPPKPLKHFKGFTLSELLIALMILGEIATFTIPKILTARANTQYNAIAKEAAGTISAAYQQLKYTQGITSNTNATDLAVYLNYIKVDTSSTVDSTPGNGTIDCSSYGTCLKLANGAMLVLKNTSFGGTGNLNALVIKVDPDGVTSTNSAVEFDLYTTGRITTWGTCSSNTINSANPGGWSADPTKDPSWFSW